MKEPLLHRCWQSVPTTCHHALHLPAQHRPSTASGPHEGREDAQSWNAVQRFSFLCFIFVFSFDCHEPLGDTLQSQSRHSTDAPADSSFFSVLLTAFYLFMYLFIFIRWCSAASAPTLPLITRTRLLLMGIHLGPTFLSVSDFFTFCIKSRKSPTTRTSLIKETGRCEIPLCKCIPSMAPHWRGANIEPSPVRSLCRRERRGTTRGTRITSCTRVIIFTWTVHLPAWDMHPPHSFEDQHSYSLSVS